MVGIWNFKEQMISNFRHGSDARYTGTIRYCPALRVYETRIREGERTIGLCHTTTRAKAFEMWVRFRSADRVPDGIWEELRFDEGVFA
jgi:hypothetical protein